MWRITFGSFHPPPRIAGLGCRRAELSGNPARRDTGFERSPNRVDLALGQSRSRPDLARLLLA
jgi:hypothetical protein